MMTITTSPKKTGKGFHKRVDYPHDVIEMAEIVKVQLLKPTQ